MTSIGLLVYSLRLMVSPDGKRQRNALTAAERSLMALGDGKVDRAIRSAGKAFELDQLALFALFPEAVMRAAGDFERSGEVSIESWDELEAVVGPGPLQFLIQELR